MADYPDRSSHHAHRLTRLLFKSAACQDIGVNATLLVIHIAHTEDAVRYQYPVRFWNGQLMSLFGWTSPKQLNDARSRAVAAGWLHYERVGTRSVGRYWTLIPDGVTGFDDSPIEELILSENGMNSGMNSGMNPCILSENGTNPGTNPGKLSIPNPNPNTLGDVSPKTPLAGTAGGNSRPPRQRKSNRLLIPYSPDFQEWWDAYPSTRKKDKPEAFRIWPEAVAAVAHDRKCEAGDAVSWLIQRARDYAASDQGRGAFCRGPAPWLNQAGWEDPPEAWKERTGNANGKPTRDGRLQPGEHQVMGPLPDVTKGERYIP